MIRLIPRSSIERAMRLGNTRNSPWYIVLADKTDRISES